MTQTGSCQFWCWSGDYSHMLTDRIINLVKNEFPSEHQALVLETLEKECGRNLPLCENADEQHLTRIKLAVLSLSKGDVEKFMYWIEVAKRDWRDVLIGN